MGPKGKYKFIAESSAKNLAAMISNIDKKNPSPKYAVKMAIELWDELVKKKITSNPGQHLK